MLLFGLIWPVGILNDSGMSTTHIPCFDHTFLSSNGIVSGHEKAVQEVLLPVVKVEKEKVEKVEKAGWGRHGQFPRFQIFTKMVTSGHLISG